MVESSYRMTDSAASRCAWMSRTGETKTTIPLSHSRRLAPLLSRSASASPSPETIARKAVKFSRMVIPESSRLHPLS